jgi:hypothetical protein
MRSQQGWSSRSGRGEAGGGAERRASQEAGAVEAPPALAKKFGKKFSATYLRIT